MKKATRLIIFIMMAVVILTLLVSCGKKNCRHRATYWNQEDYVGATCTTEGSYAYVERCYKCGEVVSRDVHYFEKSEHYSWSTERENDIEPTCTNEGSYDLVVYCRDCGAEMSRETVKIPKLNHWVDSYEIENKIPANCSQMGSYEEVGYCGDCGLEIYREKYPIYMNNDHLASSPVMENEQPANCTTEGSYEEVVYCARCHEELSRSEKVIEPNNDHIATDAVVENYVAPTLDKEGGYDEVVHCGRCDEIMSSEHKSIPKLISAVGVNLSSYEITLDTGYTSVLVAIVMPEDAEVKTVTWSSSDTSVAYVDQNGLITAKKAGTAIITATAHNGMSASCQVNVVEHVHSFSDDWTTDSTYHWHRANCIHTSQISDKSKHDWDEGVIKNAPICSSNAIKVYTCQTCGRTKQEKVVSHIYELVDSKAVSCTENGFEYIVCSVCGDEKMNVIYSTGHVMSDLSVILDADCTNDGELAGVCSGCNSYVSVRIPATGHKSDIINYNGQYCGSQKLGSICCSTCGQVVSEINHYYTKTEIKPTCDSDGRIVYSCTRCNDSYFEALPARGHVEGKWTLTLAPSCEAAGMSELRCVICDCVIDTEAEAALGHTYTTAEVYNGISYSCSVCGDSYFEELTDYVTLTFISQGDIGIDSLHVSKGESATLPVPVRDGYDFVGWYLDSELKNLCSSSYAFMENTTLYAAWNDAYATGEYNTNVYIKDVSKNFTFDVKSGVALTDSNLSSYVSVTTNGGEAVEIYILSSSQGGVYTIASKNYVNATAYKAVVRDPVGFVNTVGSELYFVTSGSNYSNVVLNYGVVSISEDDVYVAFEDGGRVYVVLYSDLLNVNNVFVVYGEEESDIISAAQVLEEGKFGNLPMYRIESADYDDIFAACDAFYMGEIGVENVQLADNIEEQLAEALEASPIYAQFRQAAMMFANRKADDYYYGLNGITVDPKINISLQNKSICASLKIVAEFARMNTRTHAVDSLLYITLELKNDLAFSATVDWNSADDYLVEVGIDNDMEINLYVSNSKNSSGSGDKSSSSIMKAFKELMNVAKELGENGKLDLSPATSANTITLGKLNYTVLYIFTFEIDITNAFDFSIVGELGVETEFHSSVTVGARGTKNNSFDPIFSISSDAKIALYAKGKIRIEDTIAAKVSVSLIGCLEAYIKASATAYFEMGGFIEASLSSKDGAKFSYDGYIDVGVSADASVGVAVTVFKVVTLYNYELDLVELICNLISQGEKEEGSLPLYFETTDESVSLDITCGEIVDISDLFDKTIVHQKLSDMTTFTEEGSDLKFYLVNYSTGINVLSDGRIYTYSANKGVYELKVKISCSGVSKIVTVIINNSHDEVYVPYLAPTCYDYGHSSYYYCENCNTRTTSYTSISPLGHSYSDEWTYNETHHWHDSTCGHRVTDGSARHSFDSGVVILDPTCSEFGIRRYTCSVCGYYYNKDIPKLSHDRYLYSVTEPNCTDKGYTTYLCYNCDYVNNTNYIAAKGHKFVDHICQVCGNEVTLDYKLSDDGTYYIVKGLGSYDYDKIVIGGTYAGLPVKEIAANAFKSKNSIKEVVIGENITTIGAYAFYDCFYLEKLTISDDVTSIGEYAFSACHLLTEVVLPKNLTEIPSGLFKYSSYLVSVTIPDGVKIIGEEAFRSCTRLSNVNIPDSVEEIGYNAFRECKAIEKVVIHDNITIINANAFYGCSKLKEVHIGRGVNYLGGSAFASCPVLNYVYFNAVNVTQCYGSNFADSGSAVSGIDFVIGNEVTQIPGRLFGYSVLTTQTKPTVHLKSLTLEENTKCQSIGEYAFMTEVFYENGYLESRMPVGISKVYISSSDLKEWCEYGFATSLYITGKLYIDGKPAYEVVLPDEVQVICDGAFINIKTIKSITIPEGVTRIGDQAFSGCENLMSIKIPSTIESIGGNAFYGCNISKIDVGSLESWLNIYYVSYENGEKIPLSEGFSLYVDGKPAYEIEVPYGITEIKAYSFNNCINIERVILPDGITVINDYAFNGCANLKSINLPEGLESIGERAFSYCHSLEKLVIPDSVTTIGYAAVSSDSLKELTIGRGVTTINAMWATNAECIYYNAVNATIQYNSALNGSTKKLIIGKEVQKINDGIFGDLTIESVEFERGSVCREIGYHFGKGGADLYVPDFNYWLSINLTSSTSNPMYNGGKLYVNGRLVTNIVIPSGISSIGYHFTGCNSITSVEIPYGVTGIGNYAFQGCKNLKEVSIPNSVQTIGQKSFENTAIREIVIPDSVTSISDSAFVSCVRLNRVTLGRNLTYIDLNAFDGCSYLVEIYNRSSLTVESYFETYWLKNIYSDSTGSSKIYTTSDGFVFYSDDNDCLLLSYNGGEKDIVLPESFMGKEYSILGYAFAGMPITSVTMSKGISSHLAYVSPFDGCNDLIYVNLENLHDKITQDHLRRLFSGCNLRVVYDPHSRSRFYENPIYIKSAEGNPRFFIDNSGYAFYEDDVVCYLVAYVGSSKHLVLPNTCNGRAYEIHAKAFVACEDIVSLVIPDGVIDSDGLTLTKFTKLQSISLGNGITSITLEGCSNLSSVVLSDEVTSIYIKNSPLLESLNIPDGVTSLYLRGCSALTSIILPEGLTDIPDYAFYNCRGIESIEIPDSVTSIGKYAFAGCNTLKSVSIGTGVVSVGESAFDGCVKINTIYFNAACMSSKLNLDIAVGKIEGIRLIIGKDVTKISDYAFKLSNVTSVEFEEGSVCESVGYSSFAQCERLTTVSLGNNVQTIDRYAFSYCYLLDSIYIPESVTLINGYAFENCNSLTRVYVDSVESWNQISFGNATANPLSNNALLYLAN